MENEMNGISQKRDFTHTEKSKIIKCPWEGCNTNAILEIAVGQWNAHWFSRVRQKQVEKKRHI